MYSNENKNYELSLKNREIRVNLVGIDCTQHINTELKKPKFYRIFSVMRHLIMFNILRVNRM